MRKNFWLLLAIIAANLFAGSAMGQNTAVRGTVKNANNKEVVQAVSVVIKGTAEGTYTDDKGNFAITTTKKPPFTLVFSSVGFETQEVIVDNASQTVSVDFKTAQDLGQEVVVSATRTPTRILESPVSIDRVSAANIRNTAASSYYDIVSNLKGVDVIASSLTFKTPTTRGFSGSGNTRFNQIMSGMDNQAPGLNFSVGSIIGLTELDVESIELLQGASSALYGPGGMLGTMLINGKNPFRYQGLSFQVKTGIMHTDGKQRPSAPYINWNVRWAQQVNSKLAFKIGAELIQAKDWLGDDYRNYKRFGTKGNLADGTRETDPNFDGVNVYGDETTINLRDVLNGIGAAAPPLLGYISTFPTNIPVSRTGYTEKEVVNPNTVNMKLSAAIHYKLTDKIEANLTGFFGTGNTIYTGSERYSLKDLKVGQYKVELNHKDWFFRAYTTQENSGESHNITISSRLFNEAWRPSRSWYPAYGQAFLAAKLAGATDAVAHTTGRAAADVGRPAAGSDQFKSLYDRVRKTPISQGGGLFLDRSDLYMIEGQYNLTDAVKFAEVLVGGNYKKYVLNSEGTLFPDKVGEPININEYGAYVQISKALLNDKLKLTASGRFDKNENFDGRFTPRLGLVFKPAKDHNIRLSFQTAYRFPSTQQQWIDLSAGGGRLLGGNFELWDKYQMTSNPVYAAEEVAKGNTVIVPFVQSKPESVTSYELGYKALIAKKLLIDVYGYYGQYENFLSRRDVIQLITPVAPGGSIFPDIINPAKRAGYSVVINAPGKVTTYGWGASAEYLLPANFSVVANISSDVLEDVPVGFQAGFNTPKYRTNFTLANSGFGPKKLFGASVVWKWQDAFEYESDFIFGPVPAYHNVDVQVNYRFPEIKSMLKLGATNVLNQYYRTGLGNSSIGGLYYVSFGYNIF